MCALAWITVGIFATAGCDSTKPAGEKSSGQTSEGEASPHPARRVARRFLEAVKYRDVDGAFRAHIESTSQGAYCRTDAFHRVMERTRREKTKFDCRDARKLDARERAALDDDAALLVQILRFTCENPEGDCLDYQERVFESHLPSTVFWSQLDGYEITQFRVDGSHADAYIDFWHGERRGGNLRHRTLELQKVQGGWVVATRFEESTE